MFAITSPEYSIGRMVRCADSLPPLAVIRMHHRVFVFGCTVHSIKFLSRYVCIAQDVSRFHGFAVPPHEALGGVKMGEAGVCLRAGGMTLLK